MNRLGMRAVWVLGIVLTLGCDGSTTEDAEERASSSASDDGQAHPEAGAAPDLSAASEQSGANAASQADSDAEPSLGGEPTVPNESETASGSTAADDTSTPNRDDPPDAGSGASDAAAADADPGNEDDDPSTGDGATPTGVLGAFPFRDSVVTRGGTMTFTNVGAPGWWPRRIQREGDNSACNYKDGSDTWGGDCCMEEHHSSSETLSPFDEEMTLIVKTIDIKQLAIYQPSEGDSQAGWRRVSDWDSRSGETHNLWFTQEGQGSDNFPGDLTANDCVGYVMQEPLLGCEDFSDYYCPDDPGILHQGYAGSKLIVFLGSMAVDDAAVQSCSGDGAGHPGPWVAMVASELVRDGGRKWNGACNCYSKTGSVGDGCGEINVFEVVMDDNAYSNREFASTGVRSYQAGHVGGSVCTADCERDAFPDDVEVIDACAGAAYTTGPELEMGGSTDGCPVWRRPDGDRYFFILFDEASRSIQVGVIHPANLPPSIGGVLPDLGAQLERSDIDALLDLRLPAN